MYYETMFLNVISKYEGNLFSSSEWDVKTFLVWAGN